MTPSEIEPATFRLVEQCLNQMRYCVPPTDTCINCKLKKQTTQVHAQTYVNNRQIIFVRKYSATREDTPPEADILFLHGDDNEYYCLQGREAV
jgi:hypothetical protein